MLLMVHQPSNQPFIAETIEAIVGQDQATLLAQPQTYMNRSGWAARCLLESHGLDPAGVLVVYDEVALPLGKLRLRKSGSPGGHRGLESVIENLRLGMQILHRTVRGICG